MKQHRLDEFTSSTSAPSSSGRRTYQPPRILYRERIEAVAAECGIVGGKSDPTCLIGFS